MDSVRIFNEKQRLKKFREEVNKQKKIEKKLIHKIKKSEKLSRVLKKNATPCENKLKKHMIVNGIKHKFQHPIVCNNGKIYILDFYIESIKLAIEVDGLHHNSCKFRQLDYYRTKQLKEDGIEVIRFSNKEVTFNIENVIKSIIDKLS